jgi:hypothetical protein
MTVLGSSKQLPAESTDGNTFRWKRKQSALILISEDIALMLHYNSTFLTMFSGLYQRGWCDWPTPLICIPVCRIDVYTYWCTRQGWGSDRSIHRNEVQRTRKATLTASTGQVHSGRTQLNQVSLHQKIKDICWFMGCVQRREFLKTRKHTISYTGSVSVIRWGLGDTLLSPLVRDKLRNLRNVVFSTYF